MNREIKFRVWNSVINRFDDNYVIRPNGVLAPISGLCMDGRSYPLGTEIVINQFTGLKDKNGKEIYEGDIIKCSAAQMMKNNTPTSYTQDFFGVIEYRGVSFQIKSFNGLPIFWSGIEIIGNIHENREFDNK